MKVGIITLHRVFNYGSVLQAYATQKIIEHVTGEEAFIIDYYSEFRTPKALLKLDGGYKNLFKRFVYRCFHSISIALKVRTFGGFLKRNCALSKEYINYSDILKNPPKADVFITGSDQVWNSIYNRGVDKAFYLQFAEKSIPKIAFVSSFGMAAIPEKEKKETLKYLSEYKAISVREDEAVKLLEKEGLPKPDWLIDPTLQLTKSEWMKIASKRLVKEPYLVLMLLYNEDEGATEFARSIADQKGLKLVKISWEMVKPQSVDKLYSHRTPEEFLSLFGYADFVVTNSFHGTAFSINFERQFVVVPRKEFNSRITSLLSLTNLSNRLVSSKEVALKMSKEKISYIKVNQILNAERKKASSFLTNNIR